MIYYLLKNIKIITISKTWVLINAFIFLLTFSVFKTLLNLFFKKPASFRIKKLFHEIYHVWKIK